MYSLVLVYEKGFFLVVILGYHLLTSDHHLHKKSSSIRCFHLLLRFSYQDGKKIV